MDFPSYKRNSKREEEVKKTKVVLLLVLMAATAILSILPQEAQAVDPVKLRGFWIGNVCNCPIPWWMYSDCDCIIIPKE